MKTVPKLQYIEPEVFGNLSHFRTLYIQYAPKLKKIPDGVFLNLLPSFKVLRITHSGLEEIPSMSLLKAETIFTMVDFDTNRIKRIARNSIRIRAENVNLDNNVIEVVEDFAFNGSQIGTLSFKGNRKLRTIKSLAFRGLMDLKEIDLSETRIEQLPTEGLESLEILRLNRTFSLKEFPSVYHFKEIREAYLTYSYHCCAFRFPAVHHPYEFAAHQDSVKNDIYIQECSTTSPVDQVSRLLGTFNNSPSSRRNEDYDNDVYGKEIFTPPTVFNKSEETDTWYIARRLGFNGSYHDDAFHEFGDIFTFDSQGAADTGVEGFFHRTTMSLPTEVTPMKAVCGDFAKKDYGNVNCFPMPDAFNPCEDVMGHVALRIAVWFVALAAVLGNLSVIVVLISSRMTVSKFLMCHLAFADFCMGLYLLIIASVDVHTIGVYFNYAIYWQHGPGCQVAGFLTVFSSELSIFTLTVITLERWYAITYAIHLNKRLHLGTAAKVMVGGWMYAITMATLPLLGISGYIKTSICLPMENSDMGDLAYLVALLSVNGFAFLLICACYIKMYICIVRQQRAPTRATTSDASVAKRMAMLVFTDFACWAPIAFFGLTAVAGKPLINVTDCKILLVFFYPLNSCANPFLYAILTKQYRRDLSVLCGRHGRSKGVKGTFSTNTQRPTSVRPICRNSVPFHGQTHGVTFDGTTVHAHYGIDAIGTAQRPKRLSIVSEGPQPALSSEDEESSSPMHKGSPHPIKNSFTKLNFQSTEQEIILKRVLGEDKDFTDSGHFLLSSVCSSISIADNNGFTNSSQSNQDTVV